MAEAAVRRRWLTALIGVGSSALFTWLAFRGVDLDALGRSAAGWSPGWALGYVAAICVVQSLRLARWAVVLRPLGERRTRRSLAIGAVGLSAIFFLPARLGELYRPLMIADRDGVGVGEAGAVVAVERLVDGVLVGAMLLLVGLWFDGPDDAAVRLRMAGAMLGGGFLAGGVGIVLAARFASRSEPLVRRMFQGAPGIGEAIVSVIERFRRALDVLPRSRAFAVFLVVSVLVWFVGGCAIVVLLRSVHMALPLSAAFVVFSALTVGMLVPAAPTAVGTAHAAVVWALGLYGIDHEPALAAAIVLHGAQVVANGIVGAIGAAAGGLDRARWHTIRADRSGVAAPAPH
jgi:uncharacterized protein (TIRG00374 family)